jgi:hypothetical protein
MRVGRSTQRVTRRKAAWFPRETLSMHAHVVLTPSVPGTLALMSHANRIVALLLVALLTIVGNAVAQKSVLVLDAGNAGGNFAAAITPVADVNGDGVLELLIADAYDDTAGPDAGRVQLIDGATGLALLTITGDQAGDLFGYAVSAVPDLDADGKGDFVVGAPGLPGSSAKGYAKVYSGADGSVIWSFEGTDPGGQYGAAVGGTDDLMADDQPGVVIGAPAEGDGNSKAGAAYIYSGVDGSQLAWIPGLDDGDKLGSSVGGNEAGSLGGPGSLMADDQPGVVIGASAEDNGGAGYVLLLKNSDLSLIARVDGAAAQDGFGTSIASLGDVNEDGIDDIAVGAAPSGTAPGYVRILSGADGATLRTITTTDTGTGFGSQVAWVGDLSEDGIGDLAISEPGADGNGTDAGRVTIYSGADGSVVHPVHGPTGSAFGTAVAFAGDVDGDGLTEIAVGAPTNANPGAAAGTAYVLSLTRLAVVGEGEVGENDIVPELRSEGGVGESAELVLHLTNARASATATLVMGSALVMVNDNLVPKSETVIAGLTTDAEGALEYALTLPPVMPAGFVVYYQYQVDDPAAVSGISRSNTVAALLP